MRLLTRTTSIRLRSETHQELQQIADRERITSAQLMRDAIVSFIEGYREESQRKVKSTTTTTTANNTEGEADTCHQNHRQYQNHQAR